MSSHGSILLLLVTIGLFATPLDRASATGLASAEMNGADEDVAGAQPSLVKRVRVLGADGRPLESGKVEITKADVFVTRSAIGRDGYIELDHSKLKSGDAYRVSVFDKNLDEIYFMDDWVYNPSDFDAVFDPASELDKYDLAIALQGSQAGALSLAVDRRVNEKWRNAVAPSDVSSTDGDEVRLPRYVAAASVVFVFGNFGADDEALDIGVPDVDPGFSLSFAYRHGYSSAGDEHSWAKYREVTLAYAQNRYTTNQSLDPNTESDVTYHRATVAYGLGRLKGRHDMSAALAIDVGGIYDGSEKLEVGDRTYGLVGFGVRGRYILRLASHVGISGDVDLMYYPADSQDNDHWYGLAPSIAIGAALY